MGWPWATLLPQPQPSSFLASAPVPSLVWLHIFHYISILATRARWLGINRCVYNWCRSNLPTLLLLTRHSGTAPDVQRSIHWTILKGAPHLNKEFHGVITYFAMGRCDGRFRRWQESLVWKLIEMHSTRIKTYRTGCPPIRETAASLRSFGTSIGPSGTPSSTEVSMPDGPSSSESDQSSIPVRKY